MMVLQKVILCRDMHLQPSEYDNLTEEELAYFTFILDALVKRQNLDVMVN